MAKCDRFTGIVIVNLEKGLINIRLMLFYRWLFVLWNLSSFLLFHIVRSQFAFIHYFFKLDKHEVFGFPHLLNIDNFSVTSFNSHILIDGRYDS